LECSDIFVKRFPVKLLNKKRLNDFQSYSFYFPEDHPKQLVQNEIFEILDQVKAKDPEWHHAMFNANIGIFEMS
jgi:hypothetical protein